MIDKKVLFLIDNLGSGGAQRQMVTLSTLFKDQGLDVSFLTYTKGDFFSKELEANNICVYNIKVNNNIKRIFKVRRFIRRGKFDVVISFMDTPNFLNNFSAIGGKSWKVITSERSSKKSYLLSKKGRFFAWFQRYSDVIVCNSYNAKEMWVSNYPKYNNKLITIYNTVNLPEITSEYTPRSDGKTHIIVAASYQYLKNPIGLINALSLLNNEERKKIRVDWYGRKEVTEGNTKAYDEAISLIEKFQLKDVIYLNEPQKDIYRLMSKADCIGLFSELEGLPNVICEGMMLGKPIVMSKVSDYYILVDESNGFLCDWDKPESIKDSIVKIINLTDEELIAKGLSSKKKAQELFDIHNVTNKWLELFDN